jgi:hypothetical protein
LIIKIEADSSNEWFETSYIDDDTYDIFITADVLKIELGKQYQNTI